jgi:hypothetical protein
MWRRNFSKPLVAVALCVLLPACAMTTPGLVGNPNGGVVRPFPWHNASPAGAARIAQRYCRSFHKRAYLTEWSPDPGNSWFQCTY